MTDKEAYILISDLAFTARDYISEAIMGMRDTESALNMANSLLLATVYIRHWREKEEMGVSTQKKQPENTQKIEKEE